MKKSLLVFLVFNSFISFSQEQCSWTLMQHDLGGFQFSNEIYEVLVAAQQNKVMHIDFTLKEYINTADYLANSLKDSSFSLFLCKYDTDSTLKIVKFYSDDDRCYITGEKYIYKHGIFIPVSTFPVSEKLMKKYGCRDKTDPFSHKKRSDWTVTNSNDSIIIHVKEGGWRYGVQMTDSIKYFTQYRNKTTYFANLKDKCIGIDEEYKIKYSGDSVSYIYSYKDEFVSTDLVILTEKHLSKRSYLKTIETFIFNNQSDETDSGRTELMYQLNRKKMPVKITVLSTENFSAKEKGSYMVIDY